MLSEVSPQLTGIPIAPTPETLYPPLPLLSIALFHTPEGCGISLPGSFPFPTLAPPLLNRRSAQVRVSPAVLPKPAANARPCFFCLHVVGAARSCRVWESDERDGEVASRMQCREECRLLWGLFPGAKHPPDGRECRR